jgi:RNase P subunit RPR2
VPVSSETYVCPECTSTVERDYRVKYVIRTCEECGHNGRFLHESLLDVVYDIPEEERPDGWADKPLDERLRRALEEGLIDRAQLDV